MQAFRARQNSRYKALRKSQSKKRVERNQSNYLTIRSKSLSLCMSKKRPRESLLVLTGSLSVQTVEHLTLNRAKGRQKQLKEQRQTTIIEFPCICQCKSSRRTLSGVRIQCSTPSTNRRSPIHSQSPIAPKRRITSPFLSRGGSISLKIVTPRQSRQRQHSTNRRSLWPVSTWWRAPTEFSCLRDTYISVP